MIEQFQRRTAGAPVNFDPVEEPVRSLGEATDELTVVACIARQVGLDDAENAIHAVNGR
jgi:hypothetical protein